MATTWDDIIGEFLHLYAIGRRLVAVAGADAERSRSAADEIAAALTAAGQQVERAHVEDADAGRLRAEVVAPFRADAAADSVLVLSGPATLLSANVRALWHFTVWQLVEDEPPHSAASALVDVTDPAHPVRRFADYCALPASYGA